MSTGILNRISKGIRSIISSPDKSVSEVEKTAKIVVFNPDNCILCGLCAKHCPTKSIEIHDTNRIRTILRNHSTCMNCNRCIDICLAGYGSMLQEISGIKAEQIDSISKELIRCDICQKPIGSKSYLEYIGNKMADKIYSNKTLLHLKFRKLGILSEKESIQAHNSASSDIGIICPKCRIKMDIDNNY